MLWNRSVNLRKNSVCFMAVFKRHVTKKATKAPVAATSTAPTKGTISFHSTINRNSEHASPLVHDAVTGTGFPFAEMPPSSGNTNAVVTHRKLKQ
jgi:hypothetical protein